MISIVPVIAVDVLGEFAGAAVVVPMLAIAWDGWRVCIDFDGSNTSVVLGLGLGLPTEMLLVLRWVEVLVFLPIGAKNEDLAAIATREAVADTANDDGSLVSIIG
jgi:hypothetical protein